MSYLTSAKPRDCFGDPDEFQGLDGKYCKVCPYREDCEKEVNNLANSPKYSTPTQRQQPMTNRYSYTRTSPSYTSTSNTTAVARTNNAPLRPIKFNHKKNLLEQYTRYVMFDVAESASTRLTELIRSSRDEYERETNEN